MVFLRIRKGIMGSEGIFSDRHPNTSERYCGSEGVSYLALQNAG